jgi:hypothetical protein
LTFYPGVGYLCRNGEYGINYTRFWRICLK